MLQNQSFNFVLWNSHRTTIEFQVEPSGNSCHIPANAKFEILLQFEIPSGGDALETPTPSIGDDPLLYNDVFEFKEEQIVFWRNACSRIKVRCRGETILDD